MCRIIYILIAMYSLDYFLLKLSTIPREFSTDINKCCNELAKLTPFAC